MKCALEVFEESKKNAIDYAYDSINVLHKICEKYIAPEIEMTLKYYREENKTLQPGDKVASISVGFKNYSSSRDIVGRLKYGHQQYSDRRCSYDIDEDNYFSLYALSNYIQKEYCYRVEIEEICYYHYGDGLNHGCDIILYIPNNSLCIK